MTPTVAEIEVWYERYEFKTWCVTQRDSEGNQIDHTHYEHFKSDAVQHARKIHSELAKNSPLGFPKLIIQTKETS